MENYLRIFDTEANYESVKDDLKFPTVSYIKGADMLHYMEKPLYELVNLGLPSGLKWAACNMGATKPEEIGLYFAWGETQGYTGITDERGFSWADYTLCNGTQNNMKKYNSTDGLITLESADDAVYTTDSNYRMPTKGNFDELIANTTTKWVNDYNNTGVAGRIFTSKINGKSIFVPASGYCYNGSVDNVGSALRLWSSSVGGGGLNLAFALGGGSGSFTVGGNYRCCGFPIRPVKE